MPAPVVHFVLALLALDFLPTKDRREFLIGASFPDIRYIAVISRDATHVRKPSWASVVREQSSFRAGMEFHSLVDVMHDRYMAKHGVYRLLPAGSARSANYLKFFEDMVIYPTRSDWQTLTTCFDTVLDEERSIVDNVETIKLWHATIKAYLEQSPTPATVRRSLTIVPLTWYGPLLYIPIYANAWRTASVLSRSLKGMFANECLVCHVKAFQNAMIAMMSAPVKKRGCDTHAMGGQQGAVSTGSATSPSCPQP